MKNYEVYLGQVRKINCSDIFTTDDIDNVARVEIKYRNVNYSDFVTLLTKDDKRYSRKQSLKHSNIIDPNYFRGYFRRSQIRSIKTLLARIKTQNSFSNTSIAKIQPKLVNIKDIDRKSGHIWYNYLVFQSINKT